MTGHAVKQSHLKMKAIVFVLFAVVGAISAAPHRRQNPMNRFVNPKRRAYDAQIRPGYTGGEPLEVGLSAYLRDIGPVDTKEDSLQLDLTLRQQWVDERLAHAGAASGRGFVSLLGGAAFGIWRPDTFFRQSRKEEGHYQLAANQYARVEKDGTVLYSTRVGLTLSCPGLAKLETVKKHVCELDVASYGLTSEDIVYSFKEGESAKFNPAKYSNGISVEKLETSDCTVKTSTGSYSCAKISIHLAME